MRFDVVIIGGGLAGITAARILEKAGFSCAVFSKGQSLNRPDTSGLQGPIFRSDKVVSVEFKNGKISAVHSDNFGKTPIEGLWFLIATGKFLAGGLSSDMDGIKETLLGLDCDCSQDREDWTAADFFADQPFLRYGVTVDENCRCSRAGKIIENLYAAGELVCGVEDIESSAVKAAQSIINARG